MTLQEMKDRKQELGLSNEEIARRAGIPLGTVMKLFGGATKHPREKTIVALERVLAPQEYRPPHSSSRSAKISWVAEAAVAYQTNRDSQYTIEDYYALPDDQRVELIDGVFYDMAAPAVAHQTILGELYLLFRECVSKHGCPCRVLFSPCDVQLDQDNRTMVQPDLLVLCRDDILKPKVIFGAPDLVIEVLSPASRGKDSILKLRKYQRAGVREFWLVDPHFQTVIVYRFDKKGAFEQYSFEDTIPVGISDGKCAIDFRIVKAAVDSLPE